MSRQLGLRNAKGASIEKLGGASLKKLWALAAEFDNLGSAGAPSIKSSEGSRAD